MSAPAPSPRSSSSSQASRTYSSRLSRHANPAARLLLQTMARKKSNLCVSVDVQHKRELLDVVEAVAPHCCAIKTHIDIVLDFDEELVRRLEELSQVHDFVIFEDRKFADIGNTVTLQYSSGVHRIASWSHLTNAHLVPGPGIVEGLRRAGEPLGRGLLLLAEMSSAGNLATGSYTAACVREARRDRRAAAAAAAAARARAREGNARDGGGEEAGDVETAAPRRSSEFVVGFIAMHRVHEDAAVLAHLEADDWQAGGQQRRRSPGRSQRDDEEEDEDFLILTPGVAVSDKGDSLGQQYRTPDDVVRGSGCDVIIVGRGIYGALLRRPSTAATAAGRSGGGGRDEAAMDEVRAQAQLYRRHGWEAYERRVEEAGNAEELEAERKGLLRPERRRGGGGAVDGGRPGYQAQRHDGADADADAHGGQDEAGDEIYHEDGSFDVFGYGSLIFKPPPHTVSRRVGYLKGFVRRFAQSSIDHRGTPLEPGRVVTLVRSSDWRRRRRGGPSSSPPEEEEGDWEGEGGVGRRGGDEERQDVVWGVSWRVAADRAAEVRRYLDWREKNGYSATSAAVYGRDGAAGGDREKVLVRAALVYVGLPTNAAYVGPEALQPLSLRIATCVGPSGPNWEYLYRLADAVRALSDDDDDGDRSAAESPRATVARRGRGAAAGSVTDPYLFALEAAVRRHRRRIEGEAAAAAAA